MKATLIFLLILFILYGSSVNSDELPYNNYTGTTTLPSPKDGEIYIYRDGVWMLMVDNPIYENSIPYKGVAATTIESSIMIEAKKRIKKEEEEKPILEMIALLKEEKQLEARLNEVKQRIAMLQWGDQN